MNDIIKKDDSVSLDTPIEELEQKLLTENNIDELNNIINIFNLNIKRKDMVRTSKLNDLQDKITNQMTERLSRNAGEFSNKDLLEYFKVLQDTINKADNSLKDIDTPAIQINQQQVNIGDGLDRDSRERVKDFISQLLAQSGEGVDELYNNLTIIDVEPEEDN